MVKGISKQVIVVHAPEEKMFEQAILILRESAIKGNGVSDEALLKEAKSLLGAQMHKKTNRLMQRLLWACAGAFVMAAVWLLTILF